MLEPLMRSQQVALDKLLRTLLAALEVAEPVS